MAGRKIDNAAPESPFMTSKAPKSDATPIINNIRQVEKKDYALKQAKGVAIRVPKAGGGGGAGMTFMANFAAKGGMAGKKEDIANIPAWKPKEE
jgi:hypothetical protein